MKKNQVFFLFEHEKACGHHIAGFDLAPRFCLTWPLDFVYMYIELLIFNINLKIL
jgi:hypothetical protein